MKRTLFTLTMIICFIWALPAMAWQDPCNATKYNYVYEGHTLTGWADTTSNFSPAPRCSGTVLLLTSDSTWVLLNYISYGDTILIANIPCRVSNKGDLVCKIITQPEISETLIFEERK